MLLLAGAVLAGVGAPFASAATGADADPIDSAGNGKVAPVSAAPYEDWAGPIPTSAKPKLAPGPMPKSSKCLSLLKDYHKALVAAPEQPDSTFALGAGEDVRACKEKAALAPDHTTAMTIQAASQMLSEPQCPLDPAVVNLDRAYPIYQGSIAWYGVGTLVSVQTDNLRNFDGTCTCADQCQAADTVLYLLKCATASCESGSVQAIDDDSHASCKWSSSLRVSIAEAGFYRAVVTSFAEGSHGRATLHSAITPLGGPTTTAPAVEILFGGGHVKAREVRSGDGLLVGKNNNTFAGGNQAFGMSGNPEYHDSLLYAFENSGSNCSGGCGAFWHNDDAWIHGNLFTAFQSRVYLSRVTSAVPGPAPIAFESGHVVVGVYDQQLNGVPYEANLRLLHVRRTLNDGGGWYCTGQFDLDGDGLTAEVEQVLGSCDSESDAPTTGMVIPGASCSTFATLVNTTVNGVDGQGTCPSPNDSRCWHAWDSDNDGKRDDWEAFAGAASFAMAPASPLYDPGTATRLDPHLSPIQCSATFCSGLDVSALSDPSVATADVLVRNQFYGCDTAANAQRCALDHVTGEPLDNRLTSVQINTHLPAAWTTDPATCWDGTNPPCTPVGGIQERVYRSKIHIYQGNPILVPDDFVFFQEHGLAGVEAGGTPRFLQWLSPERWLGTHYFTVSSFRDGQARSSLRTGIWNNLRPTVPANAGGTLENSITDFTHELGHVLRLHHPHHAYPNGSSSGRCLAGNPPTAQCSVGDCACTPVQGPFACGTASCAQYYGNPANAESSNPAVASVMSYAYERIGMMAKSAVAPPNTSAGMPIAVGPMACSLLNLRFSKGLNPALDESSVSEGITIKQARELLCMDAPDDCATRVRYGQQCSGGGCTSDFNGNGISDSGYKLDISRGNFDNLGTCGDDPLPDFDEWALMIARGKQALSVQSADRFTIFATPFNGATDQVVNYAGWPIAVDSTARIDAQGTYERNVCNHPNATCGTNDAQCCPIGSGCVNAVVDTCATSANCRDAALGCSAGVCVCADDGDCFGGVCNAVTGRCLTSTTACAAAGFACSSVGCVVSRKVNVNFPDEDEPACLIYPPGSQLVCSPSRDPVILSQDPVVRSPRESAFFGGDTAPAHLRLSSTGPTSALATIGTRNEFRLALDLRFEGLGPSQTEQVVLTSSAFTLKLVTIGGSLFLRGEVPGQPAATLTSLRPMIPHRWYRLVWEVNGNAGTHWHMISMMNPRTATFDGSPVSEQQCRQIAGSGAFGLSDTGDVILGAASVPASSATAFRGRIDNFALYNYAGAAPMGCSLQP